MLANNFKSSNVYEARTSAGSVITFAIGTIEDHENKNQKAFYTKVVDQEGTVIAEYALSSESFYGYMSAIENVFAAGAIENEETTD